MIPLRNLLRNKARSLTTIFGIAVGVAVFVAISSVAASIRREVHHLISGYDTDITVQARGAASPVSSAISQAQYLKLRALYGADVSPLAIGTLREKWNPYALVIGTKSSVVSRFGWTEGSGAALGEGEVALGVLLAQQLGIGTGGKITVAGKEMKVAGIYSIGSRFFDAGILAELSVAQELLSRPESVNLALVRVRDKKRIPAVVEEIDRLIPELKALPSVQFVGTMRLFQMVEAFARVMTLIAFLGAVTVVTNTLLMSVSERTREIGILMAVGWHPARVLTMLWSEALAMCLCGTALGNALALLLLKKLSAARAVGFGWLPATISWEVAAASLEAAVALAAAAAVWPAFVLYRLNPAEALRHE